MIITPAAVTPDLGGPYRDRRTGEVGELVEYRPGFDGARGSVTVRYGTGDWWQGGVEDFWRNYIHADVRV